MFLESIHVYMAACFPGTVGIHTYHAIKKEFKRKEVAIRVQRSIDIFAFVKSSVTAKTSIPNVLITFYKI